MKKEQYDSKSSIGTYETCPRAYKFSYIDRIRSGNQSTTIGTEVHDFIDNVFVTIKPNRETETLDNLNKLKLFPNIDYKKNILLLEKNRWKNICIKELDDSYFYPVYSEEKMKSSKLKMVGIVDRVHKCHSDDSFAPEHEEFKDGDLVIVENKTGFFTFQKAQKYEEELLWYRILIKEIKKVDIRWACIYFPHSNTIHHIDLNEPKFSIDRLFKKIDKCRDLIKREIFTPTPNEYKCKSCFYKEICKFNKNKK